MPNFSAINAVLKEYKAIAISILFLSALFFCMWMFGNESISQFGLNAFTETVGMGITVFLIDQLIKSQEKRRRRPLEVAAFRDVAGFVDGLACFWLTVYNWSGKDEYPPLTPPESMKQFLTLSHFNLIRQRLNLNAEASVFPKRLWWDYLPQAENQFRQMGEKILDRHAAVLDPNAYHLVHSVLNGFLNANTGLAMLPVSRQMGGFGNNAQWDALPEKNRYRLGRYWIVMEQYLKDFSDLHDWYQSHKKEFLGHD